MVPVGNTTINGWKEEDSKLLPIISTTGDECNLSGCEVHLSNYLLSVPMREHTIKLHSVHVFSCTYTCINNSQTRTFSILQCTVEAFDDFTIIFKFNELLTFLKKLPTNFLGNMDLHNRRHAQIMFTLPLCNHSCVAT